MTVQLTKMNIANNSSSQTVPFSPNNDSIVLLQLGVAINWENVTITGSHTINLKYENLAGSISQIKFFDGVNQNANEFELSSSFNIGEIILGPTNICSKLKLDYKAELPVNITFKDTKAVLYFKFGPSVSEYLYSPSSRRQ